MNIKYFCVCNVQNFSEVGLSISFVELRKKLHLVMHLCTRDMLICR